MLTATPIALSATEEAAIIEFLSHKGRPILERVIKGEIAAAIQASAEIDLKSPLTVLADGPQQSKSRDLCVGAARLKIFLEVLAVMSEPDARFEFKRFDVT